MEQTEQPLGERREKILLAIVESYIDSAEPVGSKAVADFAALGVSSATIRNEMGILEREGYITHPHTSAGRIPTDKGYRYYVDVLAPQRKLEPKRANEIERSLLGTLSALDDLLQRASDLLSELTDYTALASAPPASEIRLRWLDLVPLGGNRVFLVVVGEGARHEEWMIELPKEVPDELVRRTGERINRMASGSTLSEAADKVERAADGDHADVMRVVAASLRLLAKRTSRLFTGGASHVMSWGRPLVARALLEAIEEGMVGPMLPEPTADGIAIRIGSELPLRDVHDLSLIVAGYELGKRGLGTLGVLGPTRMDYPSVISSVAAVARSVSLALKRLEES